MKSGYTFKEWLNCNGSNICTILVEDGQKIAISGKTITASPTETTKKFSKFASLWVNFSAGWTKASKDITYTAVYINK